MPTLKERIQADLKSAMLARDTLTTQTLQGLKAVILNEEVAKKLRDVGLGESEIEHLIIQESKKRDDAAVLFEQGGNQASADKERLEKEILSRYMPKQMDESEIQSIVDGIIVELKPDGVKDMGRVIGAVKTKLGNNADGAIIAKIVRNSLQ
jgi:uncharacterized protein YqeY